MSAYTIRKPSAGDRPASSLFTELCTFVGLQSHGSLGWFDTFGPEPVPAAWDADVAARVNANGFAFLQLPDGSFLVLLDTGTTATPHAVALLGSEGEVRTVANSLEEFIILWSTGETGISELDDEEIQGREQLAAWVKARNVQLPPASEFDFGAWLEGSAATGTATPAQTQRKPTADYYKLGPKMRELADMMGRRADDEALIAWVTQTLGKKVPRYTADSANVVAPKAGLELAFSHNVLNEKYPLLRKSARSFIPYLSHAWVREKIGEHVFAIDLKKGTEADAIQFLGQPDGRRPQFMNETTETIAYWHRVVDAAADVVFIVESDDGISVRVSIESSRALEEFTDMGTNLFVAWAAENSLLNEVAFAQHAVLLAKVKAREAMGSDLVKAALPRGLWDSHLVDRPGFRRKAYQWFHNMAGVWITADLKKIFGARKGPYGHDEPVLDDDGWDKVDAAAPAFAKLLEKQ
jgi:hypothetical protein